MEAGPPLLFKGGSEKYRGGTVAPVWGSKLFGVGGINAAGASIEGIALDHLDAMVYDHALSSAEISAMLVAGPNGEVATSVGIPMHVATMYSSGLPYVGQKGFRC